MKAARLSYLLNDYINVSDENVDNYVSRVVIKPLVQAFDAIRNIIKKNASNELTGEAEYIFLVVAGDNFPYKGKVLLELSERAEEYKDEFVIKDFNAICIEELELLLQVLGVYPEMSFVDIFEIYAGTNKRDSLKNMLRLYERQRKQKDDDGDAISNLNKECRKKAMDKYIIVSGLNILPEEFYKGIIQGIDNLEK